MCFGDQRKKRKIFVILETDALAESTGSEDGPSTCLHIIRLSNFTAAVGETVSAPSWLHLPILFSPPVEVGPAFWHLGRRHAHLGALEVDDVALLVLGTPQDIAKIRRVVVDIAAVYVADRSHLSAFT